MIRLDEAFVINHFGVDAAIDSCHQAFCQYTAGKIINPPRTQSVKKDNFGAHLRLDMHSEWPKRYSARKIIEECSNLATGRLGPRTSAIHLTNLETGEEAVIDADHITNMRTGAAGALAIKYLTTRPIYRISIVGTGKIAQSLALCADSLINPKVISVTSRNARNRDNFKKKLESKLNASLVLANSIESCVAESEVILCAVPSTRPILGPELFSGHPAAIIALAGDPRTRQLSPEILEDRDVVVDNLDQARESGEFLYAQEKNRVGEINLRLTKTGRPYTIGDAACYRIPIENDSSIVAYLTGLAAQDLCAAIMIYKKYKNTL